MRVRLFASVLALGLIGASSAIQAAGGKVEIAFVSPERFADAGAGRRELQSNMMELARHFERLGARTLAPDELLRVEILDLNLAGQLRRIGPQLEELRVIDGKVDWPTIRLRYRLEREGAQVFDGEETLTDMYYFGKAATYPRSEALRYEKPLLDRWFNTRIIAH